METKILLFLCILNVYSCCGQDDDDKGLATSSCIFSCIQAFQRKGVEGATDTGTGPDQVGCDGLNMDTFLDMCDNYQKASTCLSECENDETKKVVLAGFNYICITRIQDYKKYMPCYKQHCSDIADSCTQQCGSFSDATQQWMTYLSIYINSTSAENNSSEVINSRRKRQSTDNSGSGSGSGSGSQEANGDDLGLSPQDTCKYAHCYVNCSRPIMENYCGTEAYQLLKQTSNILLSFLIAPLQESSFVNGTSDIGECQGYVSAALNAESSAGSQTIIDKISPILLFSVALLMMVLRREI